jgi:hypothetical protein
VFSFMLYFFSVLLFEVMSSVTGKVFSCNVIQFSLSHLQENLIQATYRDKEIKEISNIKLLGFDIDKHLSWKTHIVLVIPRLSSASYAIRSMFHFSNMDTLNMICFAYSTFTQY